MWNFVLGRLALRQAFLRILRVSPAHVIPSVLRTWYRSPNQTGPGAHSVSWTMGTGFVFRGYSGRVMALTIHPHLVPRLRRADLYFSPPSPSPVSLGLRGLLKRELYLFTVLGTFAKLRKATTNFVMSVRLSAWNNSAPTGRIFMKFGIKYISKIFRVNSSFIEIWQE